MDLTGLLDAALVTAAGVAAPDSALLAALRGLRDRLAGERLQLAVVGQFKRGKSTLLNALIGAEVLPTGVLPLTAVPTFLEQGASPELVIGYEAGRNEVVALRDMPTLNARLTGLVTEEGNPRNAQGLSRVTVRLPSVFLQNGLVLVDTPGVGSTQRHNTQVAEAALPASDAALFVVSPDPPITDVELGYLVRVRATAARTIVVLNKADLLDPAEIAAVEDFLRKVLTEATGASPPPVFRLSARAALRAKLSGDLDGLAASGLPALEAYLVDLIGKEKPAVLGAAIAGKARAVIVGLRLQNDLALQALHMPLEDLERRRGVFHDAIGGFEVDRQAVLDLMAGDQKRTLAMLDDEAERMRRTAGTELERQVERGASEGQGLDAAWQAVRQGLPDLFDAKLQRAMAAVREWLDALFGGHQQRIERLTDLVQRTAAELMDVSFQPTSSREPLEARRLPYWVLKPAEGLNPIPPGALEALLPPKLRARRVRWRIKQEIAAITMRNVENLRWALRQNVQDAFLRFAGELDERFSASLAITRDVLDEALRRRGGYAAEIELRRSGARPRRRRSDGSS